MATVLVVNGILKETVDVLSVSLISSHSPNTLIFITISRVAIDSSKLYILTNFLIKSLYLL